MKKDQFLHNLEKHKRQQEHKREDKNIQQLSNLFKDFGEIYTNNKN